MNIEETKTYLVLKYGSMFHAHQRWQMNQCFSEADDEMISILVAFYLNERTNLVDK